MKRYSSSISYLLIIFISLTSDQVDAKWMLDWIWGSQDESSRVIMADEVPLISIPYEMMTEDEKFLKEAAKFVTDIQISSPLEVCQHKVVLKIKTSCSSMTEEQLAKLSVNLLNCQSAAEGRKVFPCTEDMTLKQCTVSMDADTWNAYHLMSNRARAVCYAARSHQFRALTELTVNKLMQSAQSQIQTLSNLKESQDRLEEQTFAAHRIIETNIQDLTEEKALIRAGHKQLAAMTEDIKQKLENATQDLLQQSSERSENHKELLEDLENIKYHAQLLWGKIESSTNRIIEQNHEAALQYEETLVKLEKINQTIIFISDLTSNMRTEIDKKLGWITEYIGKTGENLEKIYRIILHVVYLLGAMIVAAFLQAPFLTRTAIMGMVPLNLFSYLKHGLNACLDFVSLTVLILLITAMHYIMNGIQYLVQSRNNNTVESEEQKTSEFNGNAKMHNDDTRKVQRKSLLLRIYYSALNTFTYLYQQVLQSIENLKNTYYSIKSWAWQKFVPTEELSCSYVPLRKYQDRILFGKEYASMSDDELSDLSDSGIFLSRKIAERKIRPSTSFLEAYRESAIRETMFVQPVRQVSSRSVTPVSRPLCAAKTRSGNPCRLVASKGQNYCHRHASGSSSMGD